MTDLTVQGSNSVQQKKVNYVARGAAIGAGVDLGLGAIGRIALRKQLGKDTFELSSKIIEKSIGKGKYAALCVAGIAMSAGIGALIGKIVENHKAKKQVKNSTING